MDVLSNVLKTLQVHGAILSDCWYQPPWGVRFGHKEVAGFHLLIEGACWLRVRDRRLLRVLQGDIVIVPNGLEHVLCDEPETKAVDVKEPCSAGSSVQRRTKPGASRIACGAFRFAHGAPNPLLAVLPPVLHLSAAAIQRDHALRATLHILVAELSERRSGSEVLIDRMIDALFITTVRRWIDEQPANARGWLVALRDERMGKVLGAMHQELKRPWSLASLAREAGMSRAAFARRFSEQVGEPPLSYLTRRRIETAAHLLTGSEKTVADIAHSVGYDNEFAFSRAFKRETGRSPRQLRTSAGDR